MIERVDVREYAGGGEQNQETGAKPTALNKEVYFSRSVPWEGCIQE